MLAALACILIVWALVQGDPLAAVVLFATVLALYATARAVGWVFAGLIDSDPS